MRQEPRGQKPGIDLTFSDGRTGRIWGSSGIDDSRGISFQMASVALKERAEQEDAFEWHIIIELDQVMSAAFKSLLRMITSLDQIVASQPDRRRITVEWRIRPADDNMRTMAIDTKRQIERGRRDSQNFAGVLINIVERAKDAYRLR